MQQRTKVVNANDSVMKELRFDVPKTSLMKNDLAVLNIIAANKWVRPNPLSLLLILI
jgi:hypothetical protein